MVVCKQTGIDGHQYTVLRYSEQKQTKNAFLYPHTLQLVTTNAHLLQEATMPSTHALSQSDPRSTLPIGGQEQKWVTLFTQLIANEGQGLDDPSITPLDLLIRCADHFTLILARYKRAYRDPEGNIASYNRIFRVLITAYRDPFSKETTLHKKEQLFVIFHDSLTRSHYTLE